MENHKGFGLARRVLNFINYRRDGAAARSEENPSAPKNLKLLHLAASRFKPSQFSFTLSR